MEKSYYEKLKDMAKDRGVTLLSFLLQLIRIGLYFLVLSEDDENIKIVVTRNGKKVETIKIL